jgi:lipoprotein-anchoring transpeptidase ErfK/SrfK
MTYLDKKKYLTEIRSNYYLSKNDPLYWHKLLRFKPEDGEALYHVGLDQEEEAKRNLLLYERTHRLPFLKAYQLYLEKALASIHKAARYGYIQARPDRLRIEESLNRINRIKTTPTSSESVKNESSGFPTIPLLLSVIAFLLLGGLLFTFLQDKIELPNKQTILNNHFTSFVPYQVKYEKPSLPPNLVYREESTYIDPVPSLPLADALVNKMKESYKLNPSTPLKIRALDPRNGSEKGLAVWNDPNSEVEVYIYPENEVDPLLLESTTVLRSTLYHYVQEKGYFPPTLAELSRPFPENYLSSIPKESRNSSSQETPILNETGGWVYTPLSSRIPPEDLKSRVTEVLEPNLSNLTPLVFEPLSIEINKTSNVLTLKSGDQALRSYPVALGKDDLTPEGEFTVQKKIANPNTGNPESVFGTRALELSNPTYAIHGTNDPSSIGENVSHGCIRLTNPDVEELYSLVPIGTPVKIKTMDLPGKDVELLGKHVENPYISRIAPPKEEDPSRVYYWSE